jgi:hypothetical protein
MAMTTYHQVLAFLALVGAAWLALTVLDWRRLLTRPEVACCAVCGLSDPVLLLGRCAPCRYREEQAEQMRRNRSLIEYRAKLARWRAEDEAARLAARLPLLTIGAVYRNHAGEPVYDGFVFERPADAEDLVPAEIRQTGRYPLGALICGWRPAELHALAHGAPCTCLD